MRPMTQYQAAARSIPSPERFPEDRFPEGNDTSRRGATGSARGQQGDATDKSITTRATEGASRAMQKGPTRTVLFFVVLFGVSLFYVWGHTQVLRATYTLAALKKHERELLSQNERLQLEISTLSAPAALGKVAREQLELTAPEPGQVIMVK